MARVEDEEEEDEEELDPNQRYPEQCQHWMRSRRSALT
jgi:hypothetical protein